MRLKNAYSKCMECGGKMKKGMKGMSVPRVQGSVVASTPMAKSGQSFPSRNSGKSADLIAKAKAKLKKAKAKLKKN